jgi:hypothetical protein
MLQVADAHLDANRIADHTLQQNVRSPLSSDSRQSCGQRPR